MDARICEKKKGKWIEKHQLCDFKNMKKPSHSSIEWTNIHPISGKKVELKHDLESVVAKGTASALLDDFGLKKVLEMAKEKKSVEVSINPKMIHYPENPTDDVKIGNSFYSKRRLYQVLEEISGKRIITKEGTYGARRIVKSAVGTKFVLNTLQNPEDDNPLVIEANKGYYIIAPKIHWE
jgi:hypothetical protein